VNTTRQWLIKCKYPEAKILVIDDAEEFIDLISITLRKAGYKNIVTLLDPVLSPDYICSEQPDVILLDYEMPGLNGLEILKAVASRKTYSYLPVLILTANDDLQIRRNCLESGAQDFIQKPFEKMDLLLKINNVIHVSMIYKRLESENSKLGDTVRNQKSAITTERSSRQEAEEKLQHHIYHDLLTNLPNKLRFTEYLLQEINIVNQDNSTLAIFVLTLDNLRDINYTLGHINGDSIIKTLSQRLESFTLNNDDLFETENHTKNQLARISGNSFAILAPNITDKDQSLLIAEHISELIDDPISINDLRVTLQGHVGIVHYPVHGGDVDTLLKNADIAAYQAKSQSKRSEIYSHRNDDFTRIKLEMAQSLSQAIEEDTLNLYLQPKLSLARNEVIGFEFLLRWEDPILGFVPPEQIVSTAEKTGLISSLTRWVIKRAVRVGKRLADHGYPLSLAINVTASDILDITTMQHLIHVLRQYNVNADRIILEITEGTMVQDQTKTMEIIRQYSKLGVKLSIDDFGTGYSSLAYLQKLHVDELKIDRSFIMDLDTNTNNQKIVQSIIDIAHHLNLSVVAEGIENQNIYDLLQAYHCDVAQGYHMAKPMPEDQIFIFLEQHFSNLQKNIRKTS